MKKFGTVLTSRQSGREAYAAFLPTINAVGTGEDVEVDFAGISALSPSWGDEFLTPLLEKFGTRLKITNAKNPSVALTLDLIEKIHGQHFSRT